MSCACAAHAAPAECLLILLLLLCSAVSAVSASRPHNDCTVCCKNEENACLRSLLCRRTSIPDQLRAPPLPRPLMSPSPPARQPLLPLIRASRAPSPLLSSLLALWPCAACIITVVVAAADHWPFQVHLQGIVQLFLQQLQHVLCTYGPYHGRGRSSGGARRCRRPTREGRGATGQGAAPASRPRGESPPWQPRYLGS